MDLSEIYQGLLSGPTAKEKDEAMRMGLLSAGLGILANNRGNYGAAGPALGAGGLLGLQAQQSTLANLQGQRKADLQASLQALQIKKAIEQQAALANFGKGRSPGEMALTAGSAVGDIGPTQTNLKRLDAVGDGQPGIPDFQSLIAAGVPAETVKVLMEDWKLKNPELSWQGGMPRNPRSGAVVSGVPAAPQTNPQGFSTTPRFNPSTGQIEVGITPGGAEAYRLQQDIGESSKASRDPFMGVTDPQGRQIPMTREVFSQQFGGGRGGQGQGMGPTPAQRQSAVTTAEGDAKRVLDLEAKIPPMLSVVRRLDRMERLTADDTTYAAAGAELKNALGSIAQGFGLPVKREKTGNTEEYLAHVAELLKDRLASKDYGSGSGVSNLDIIAARAPLPELVKTAQGRQQIIQAIRADAERNITDAQAARDFFDANSGLRGFRFPSELAAEQEKRKRALPKEPGTPQGIPQGVTVRRIR